MRRNSLLNSQELKEHQHTYLSFKFVAETISIITVCLRSYLFDEQGCDFTVCSGARWNTFKV